MSIQKELIENICAQVEWCLMNIKLSVTLDKHHILKLELQHLDLLLDLLLSKISIRSYIKEYSSLFSSEGWEGHLEIYIPHILFLEQQQTDIVSIDDEVICFVDILQICRDNMKRYIGYEKYEAIQNEVYYNHNVPSLIATKEIDLIKYYLSTECGGCRSYCSKEMVQSYESTWEKIAQQFFPQEETEALNGKT